MTNLSRVDNYTISKKLGEGAMSEVFMAHSHNSGNVVAIKIPKVHLKNKQEYLDRMRKEAEILSMLDDQRIVQLLSFQENYNGNICLVQEYVNGKNLEELITTHHQKIKPIIGAIIISEILLGLEVAHRHNVIHRDLKPENIMITPEGKIKITDFGVSKNLIKSGETATGVIIGSPAYIAPEQIKGEVVEPATDLFSLGVILYRYCTGEFPFKGDNYSALLHDIINNVPTPPNKHNPRVHPELAKIINKALKKSPSQRYSRAYEFRYDLMKYLDTLGAINPTKLLKMYYEQDCNIDEYFDVKLEGTIIRRAEDAFASGDQKNGMILVQQALAVAPDNQEVSKLLKKSSSLHLKSNKRIVIIPLLSIVACFISLLIFYFHREDDTAKKVTPALVVKPSMPAVITSTPEIAAPVSPAMGKTTTVNEVKKIKKIIAKKENKKKSENENKNETATSWITFNVNEDVSIYVDGKIVAAENKSRVEVLPGVHRISLSRPGSPTIAGTIETFADKGTTINAN
ncbi:MAG: serine/threonine protein kinase [Oligoflexia bacterium]|nr:serine/threonine protein kinase [Oligoflexia bacterium]